MNRKKYTCSLGEIDYSQDDDPKLVKQNWRVREDSCETIAIFLRDSLKEFFKSDMSVHIPIDEAYKNDIKVQNKEMSEEKRKTIENTYKEVWQKKVLKVITLFDEYVKNYWKVDSSSKHNYKKEMKKHSDIAKEGFDALKEIFDELIL